MLNNNLLLRQKPRYKVHTLAQEDYEILYSLLVLVPMSMRFHPSLVLEVFETPRQTFINHNQPLNNQADEQSECTLVPMQENRMLVLGGPVPTLTLLLRGIFSCV